MVFFGHATNQTVDNTSALFYNPYAKVVPASAGSRLPLWELDCNPSVSGDALMEQPVVVSTVTGTGRKELLRVSASDFTKFMDGFGELFFAYPDGELAVAWGGDLNSIVPLVIYVRN